jgi:hypothetical protein
VNFICTSFPFLKQEGGYLSHNSPLNRETQREREREREQKRDFHFKGIRLTFFCWQRTLMSLMFHILDNVAGF